MPVAPTPRADSPAVVVNNSDVSVSVVGQVVASASSEECRNAGQQTVERKLVAVSPREWLHLALD